MNASIIIIICWLILAGYWVSKWKNVKPTKETAWRESGFPWIVILSALILVIILHIVFPAYNVDLFSYVSGPITSIQVVGITIDVIGLIFTIIARKTLADNWSSNVDIKKYHKLITTGIYGIVRHPIYTGIITMGFGSFIAEPSIPDMFFLIIITAFFMFKMNKEEKLLSTHFPKDYALYKKKTKAIIPYLY